MRLSDFLAVTSLLLIVSCSSGDQTGSYIPEDMSKREKNRYLQYLVQGKRLYTAHCANCHRQDGTGLNKLYPPLAKSDFLLGDVSAASCLIKYGQSGKLIVNGVEYNMQMPALPKLSNIEIAEILTYIANNWENRQGLVPVQSVNASLKLCQSD